MSLRRDISNLENAENFLEEILGECPDTQVVHDIVQAELSLRQLEQFPTNTHTCFRERNYRSSTDREKLQKQILKELIHETRLPNDNNIQLGVGGARPDTPCINSQAYIVSGAPASGKSTFASQLANITGSYILDSDYAKRKLPEYSKYYGGASLVHKESDAIIFGSENSLLEFCVYKRFNVVLPLVGRTFSSVESICKTLINFGYNIHLINVSLDRRQCVKRAYNRFVDQRRYVPLSYIFDEVANEPERIYYQMRRTYQSDPHFSSFSLISTEGTRDEPPKILETFPSHESPIYDILPQPTT